MTKNEQEFYNMDRYDILEESMKVLDILSEFINEESDNYLFSDEIRTPLEQAFQTIFSIYEKLGDDTLVEELRDKWEDRNKH